MGNGVGHIQVERLTALEGCSKALPNVLGEVVLHDFLREHHGPEAAKRAHAHKFIVQLPGGYDTVIGEDGGTFSQGQKQLLCIARVMLTDPAILLLDEATSSIGFGAIIGTGWVLQVGDWMVVGGGPVPAMIAFLLGAIFLMPVGAVFGELTAAIPISGGIVLALNAGLGLEANIAKICATALVMVYNFVTRKIFLEGDETK